MKFTPPRGLGVSIGGMILLLLLGTSAFAVIRLSSSVVSPLTPLWVFVPLFGLPMSALIGYCLYGLLTAHYRLDRDGFYLAWGLASEAIPLGEITSIQRAGDVIQGTVLPRGMAWPGCLVGERMVEGVGRVEFFTTRSGDRMLLVNAGDRHLAISPPDNDAFLETFGQMTQMGSLTRIETKSHRPDFLLTRLWRDRLARALILAGLGLPLTLLCYLALRAPSLPAEVPFGFDPTGLPYPLAPPGRLLLLPLIGGMCWLADLALGTWLYANHKDRILAYAMWGSALLVAGLLWGAALHLLAAA
jgi:hypothetical protein